jgi:hypothetical protein
MYSKQPKDKCLGMTSLEVAGPLNKRLLWQPEEIKSISAGPEEMKSINAGHLKS